MSAPTEPRPWPGAPEYFRRAWAPPEDAGNAVFVLSDAVVIYGIAHTSPFREDRAYERRCWAGDQSFMAWHFSPLCPEGEPGIVRLADVEPITAAEFTAAREAGWPQ